MILSYLIQRPPSSVNALCSGQEYIASVRNGASVSDKGPGFLPPDERRWDDGNQHYVRWQSSGWCAAKGMRPCHLLVECGGSVSVR